MHTDQRTADVHARGGPDLLNKDGVVKALPAVRGPAAARVGLRNGRDDLIAVGLRGLALNDDRTVQMLTALGGQIDALLLQWRQHARQHGSGSLHAGILADVPAHDLAAGAADHKNVPGLKMRSLQQFFRSLPRLRRKFCIIHR